MRASVRASVRACVRVRKLMEAALAITMKIKVASLYEYTPKRHLLYA